MAIKHNTITSDSKPFVYISKTSITEKKINSFSKFTNGWSYGRGIQFSEDVIASASRVLKLLHNYGFIETDAFPGEDGEIMITAYKNEFCCEIITYQNGKYDFIVEKNNDEIIISETIYFSKLNKLIEGFRGLTTCNSSESSIQNILTKKEKDSRVWLSEIQAETVEFPLLTKFVSDKQSTVFTSIFSNITQKLPEIRLSSGHFLRKIYHQHTS